MARRLIDENGRVIPRAAAGLPDAARLVRAWRQAHPDEGGELDKDRRWAFYVHKNSALIEVVAEAVETVKQRERGRRRHKETAAADVGRIERYRAAEADPEVTTRKELARRTEPGDKDHPPWTLQALRNFELRMGIKRKRLAKRAG